MVRLAGEERFTGACLVMGELELAEDVQAVLETAGGGLAVTHGAMGVSELEQAQTVVAAREVVPVDRQCAEQRLGGRVVMAEAAVGIAEDAQPVGYRQG